jgi:succinate dehydrogenase hydrophobic anchor subunit
MHDIMLLALLTAAPPDHTTALHAAAYTVSAICIALFIVFLVGTSFSWKPIDGAPVRSLSRERAEKSCDTVLSVCALLIPATLGLITWLNDKVGTGIYMAPLGLALLFFFSLLAFTIHLRFNFLWRYDTDFIVTSKHNARFAYWLTTATTAIVLGLVLLTVPVIELGLGLLHFKSAEKSVDPPPPPPIKVECNCKPPTPPPPPPPCKQPPPPHHHHRRPPCACQKK